MISTGVAIGITSARSTCSGAASLVAAMAARHASALDTMFEPALMLRPRRSMAVEMTVAIGSSFAKPKYVRSFSILSISVISVALV